MTIDGLRASGASNANGLWTVDSVPAGTHTLVFMKQGYHTRRARYVTFTGRGRMYVDGDVPANAIRQGNRVHLYAVTTATVELEEIRVMRTYDDYHTCVVSGRATTRTGCTNVALYMNRDPNTRRRRDIETTPFEQLVANASVRSADGHFEIPNVQVHVGDTISLVAAAGVPFPYPVYDPDIDRVLDFAPGARSQTFTWIAP